jgi:F0F1-type ATP synthase membrane subunit b/b'
VFRIPEEQKKYEYGSPEFEALQDISARISKGLDERQASREEAADRASQLLEQCSKMQEEYHRAFDEVYGVG